MGRSARAVAMLAFGFLISASIVSSAEAAETRIVTNSFGSFNEPQGVAVDSSTNPADPAAGDIYVVDTGNHRVVRFDSSDAPASFSALVPISPEMFSPEPRASPSSRRLGGSRSRQRRLLCHGPRRWSDLQVCTERGTDHHDHRGLERTECGYGWLLQSRGDRREPDQR